MRPHIRCRLPYVAVPGQTGRAYADLHEHVAALSDAGLLYVVNEPINKDTEIHPLVRWQYRGGIAADAAQGVPVHAADRCDGPVV